jgi:hypothetical protein
MNDKLISFKVTMCFDAKDCASVWNKESAQAENITSYNKKVVKK